MYKNSVQNIYSMFKLLRFSKHKENFRTCTTSIWSLIYISLNRLNLESFFCSYMNTKTSFMDKSIKHKYYSSKSKVVSKEESAPITFPDIFISVKSKTYRSSAFHIPLT